MTKNTQTNKWLWKPKKKKKFYSKAHKRLSKPQTNINDLMERI